MATRKPITKQDLIREKSHSRDQGYNEGFTVGKQHGFLAGENHARTEVLNKLKRDRMLALMDALTKTSQAVDSIAHLACAIAKESL
jgi:flagellar biosynthesis/type III secretory pathway protein FliH